jgi:hypothetical protein
MELKHFRIPSVATMLVGLVLLGSTASSASASTILVFQEPHKGSTGHIVDVPPLIGPGKFLFSAGDEVVFSGPLAQNGKVDGKIRGICTATQSAYDAVKAGFLCNVLATIPGGTLSMASPYAEPGNRHGREGAVVGGTGKYAGAHGTFRDEQGHSFDTDTINLLE